MRDSNGLVQTDAAGAPVYEEVTAENDLDVRITDDGVQFNFVLAGDIFAPIEIDLDFNESIPGLGLESNSKLLIQMDYLFALGFGLSVTDGFFVDTTGVTKSGAEFAIQLSAALQENSALQAKLGFLNVKLQDLADDDGTSGFFGEFEVDLTSSSGNRWRPLLGDSLSVEATLSADANFDIEIDVDMASLETDLALPSLNTVLRYDQTFVSLSSSTGSSGDNSPLVVLSDVTLDVGTFINDFAGPVLDVVSAITEPLEPIVELLTDPIDLLVDLGMDPEDATLLSIARKVLGPQKFASVERGIQALRDVIDFVDAVQAFRDSPESSVINFGSFTLTGGVRADGGAEAKGSIPDDGFDAKAAAGASGTAKGVLDKIGTSKGSLRFPLLEKPSSVLGLLTGQADVDLFIYDMPNLGLDFQWKQAIPIFTGVSAVFGGGVSANTNFSFGFDTSGLNQWADTNFDVAQSHLFLNGFFLDDHQDGTNDEPEATLSASLIAGAQLGILIKGEVAGDITSTIEFDLNDPSDPDDGKLTLVELADNIALGPQCLFDMSGAITAGLTASLLVDVGFTTFVVESIELARGTIANFEFVCNAGPPPSILAPGDLAPSGDVVKSIDREGNATYYDKAANGVINIQLTDADDRVEVRSTTASNGDEITQIWYAGGITEVSGVTKIVANAMGGEDSIIVQRGVTASVELDGGADDDTLNYKGSGDAKLSGGPGNDVLRGGSGNDMLEGGDGNDTLRGGPGLDSLDGGGGDDALFGDDGNDTLHGGAGLDELDGGGGVDTVDGQAGDDIYLWQNGSPVDVIADTGVSSGDEFVLAGGTTNPSGAGIVNSNDNVILRRGAGGLPEVVGTTTQSFSNIEKVTLAVGSGADTITVEDLSLTSITSVGIDLGRSANDGADTVIINGTAAADTIAVQGTTVSNDSGTVTFDAVQVDYGTLSIQIIGGNKSQDSLRVLGNGGEDVMTVSNAAPRLDTQLMVSLKGGDDNDTFSIPYVDIEIMGGGGTNTLEFTGNTSTDRSSVSLSTDATDNSRGSLSVELPTENLFLPFQEITNLTLSLSDSGGGETVTVQSSVSGLLEILGSAGNDIVNIQSLPNSNRCHC